MSIEIKKLSPELIGDYIEFFDKVAFTDNEEWAGCYCLFYHWNDRLEEEQNNLTERDILSYRKDHVAKFIESGTLQGYLAYENNCVIGWINANDKYQFNRLSPDIWPEIWDSKEPTESIKSIVCYTIAPEQRRRGVATMLLEKVCLDARTEGYSYIEAYPGTDISNMQRNYHGPALLYEKQGFVLHKNLGEYLVVRKYLS
jgi:GNAT superfamily N-acetyltransferase